MITHWNFSITSNDVKYNNNNNRQRDQARALTLSVLVILLLEPSVIMLSCCYCITQYTVAQSLYCGCWLVDENWWRFTRWSLTLWMWLTHYIAKKQLLKQLTHSFRFDLQLPNFRGQACASIGKSSRCMGHSAWMVNLRGAEGWYDIILFKQTPYTVQWTELHREWTTNWVKVNIDGPMHQYLTGLAGLSTQHWNRM